MGPLRAKAAGGWVETIAVMDFETTGGAANAGGRATEIAIILLRGGREVDRFQSLMRTGVWIPPFIEELTGITNEMTAAAPPASVVMEQARRFAGAHPLAAHNASFDSKFWDAELARLGRSREPGQHFACTMLLARRVYPEAPNHKLGSLARHARVPQTGRAHRAMADTEVAAGLLARMQAALMRRHGLSAAPHELLRALQSIPAKKCDQAIQGLARELGCAGEAGA